MNVDSPYVALLRPICESTPLMAFAALFGSAARNQLRAGSDLDIAVSWHEPVPYREEESLRQALSRAAQREVDLIDVASAPPLLNFEIGRDGQLIFASRQYAWADFRAKSMLDWWDFQPLFARMQVNTLLRLRRQVACGSR